MTPPIQHRYRVDSTRIVPPWDFGGSLLGIENLIIPNMGFHFWYFLRKAITPRNARKIILKTFLSKSIISCWKYSSRDNWSCKLSLVKIFIFFIIYYYWNRRIIIKCFWCAVLIFNFKLKKNSPVGIVKLLTNWKTTLVVTSKLNISSQTIDINFEN